MAGDMDVDQICLVHCSFRPFHSFNPPSLILKYLYLNIRILFSAQRGTSSVRWLELGAEEVQRQQAFRLVGPQSPSSGLAGRGAERMCRKAEFEGRPRDAFCDCDTAHRTPFCVMTGEDGT